MDDRQTPCLHLGALCYARILFLAQVIKCCSVCLPMHRLFRVRTRAILQADLHIITPFQRSWNDAIQAGRVDAHTYVRTCVRLSRNARLCPAEKRSDLEAPSFAHLFMLTMFTCRSIFIEIFTSLTFILEVKDSNRVYRTVCTWLSRRLWQVGQVGVANTECHMWAIDEQIWIWPWPNLNVNLAVGTVWCQIFLPFIVKVCGLNWLLLCETALSLFLANILKLQRQ